MARLRYIADNPRGPRGGNHDARTLYSSADSAARNILSIKDKGAVGSVLVVDLDELLTVKAGVTDHVAVRGPLHTDVEALFAWHEARSLHHTSEMMRLRPLAEGVSKDPLWLTTLDLARIREVVSEWVLEEDRLRRGGGATPAARGAFFVLWDFFREGKLGGAR